MDIVEKIKSRVAFEGECWVWQGAKNSAGYANVYYEKRHWLGHRLLYTKLVRPLKPFELLCHSCDTPACVNPNHMFIGDQRANLNDMSVKGRRACGTALSEKIKAGWTPELRAMRAEQTAKRAAERLTKARQEAGVSDDHHRCCKCRKWKPSADFSRNRGRPPSICKACRRLHKV